MVFGFFACIADAHDFCLCPGWVAPRCLSSDCPAFSFFFNGFEEDGSDPRGRVANASFLGWSELGFRWCLAFSHALPMRLRFLPSDCAAFSFSCNSFEEDVSDPCGRAANASFWACLSSDLGGVCPATALLDPSLVITASKRALLGPSLVIIVIIK